MLFSVRALASADSFDWRNVNGLNWNTSVKGQFGGTCWDFPSSARSSRGTCLPATTLPFCPICRNSNSAGKPIPIWAARAAAVVCTSYNCTHGVVSETECPVEANSAYWDAPGPGDPWPLASGWQNRLEKHCRFDAVRYVHYGRDQGRYLKQQGPLLTGILPITICTIGRRPGNELSRSPMPGVDHAVVITGYQRRCKRAQPEDTGSSRIAGAPAAATTATSTFLTATSKSQ